ncbi:MULTISPECIES: hypothetical protein [Kitasatospora]|uniref:DUF6891 domain-containing protein n=1 Tax=Kitasatospora setae (strain ATCC 33774 / DSM 43861 / JCM 3304 / KCC A-0304 / NBRC 14216 / KM-6054) TaxID=452652 RepID=E4NH95_KITSK|nr:MULTISPECIES: hypothetical protein [Kitasatospora]BAJ30875.1 hypothetical protein KSE_50970 [Kitasatospora setae KM-6054]
MLEIAVQDKSGRVGVRVSEDELRDLVRDMGQWKGSFLVLQRVPDLPDTYAQTCPEDGAWTVEHRDGAQSRHFAARVTELERVAELLVGWARQDADWAAGEQWERIDFGPDPEPAPLELSAEDEEALIAEVRRLLVGGYATLAQAAEAAEEYLVDGEHRPVSREQARQLAERLWRERVAEQRAWTGETDPERLARAFAVLDAAGITAREDFTCCGSCGYAEIGAEAAPGARGFVFFHSQSTDGAAAGGDLWLQYGGFDGSEATTAAVGREVVAALAGVGLATAWDGEPDDAIRVTGLDWRRRLVG